MTKKLMLIGLTTLALGGAALAAPGDNPRRRAEYFTPEGHLMVVDMTTSTKVDEMVKHAKRLPKGTIVVTVDGEFYIVQDAKMADGTMLHDALK